MDERTILKGLYDTGLGMATREAPWLFSTFEVLHFIGLSLLFGAMLLVDLRLMGWLRSMPIRSALNYTHVAVLGFALSIVSGAGFFCSDPFNYWGNPVFRLKMALVALALGNVVWFELAERTKIRKMAPDGDTDIDTKLVAGLSLALWTVIMVLGRLLPQFGVNG